ncbi:CBS domain-containing protein [Comamonas terrigena]|uniref:CBS domain-containing protein n=1 Tax=Comamonas terrigena TaxID=32013 RepID=UPI00289A69A7|nr:CBS domain-containing protein [Comamonas terrigena]
MFYVFGINGPMYHGGPERLSQIAPVRRVQRPQALNTLVADTDTDSSTLLPQPSTETTLRRVPAQSAVSAYASAAQGPKEERRPLSLVRDVMTRGALTVSPRSMVNDAWQTLALHRVSQAPVLNDAQQVIGLLLRADMAPLDLLPTPGAVRDAIALTRRPVSEVMVTPVPTVAEDTDLRRVAGVLLDNGLPGLPVTDEQGHLAGFISRTDLLKAIASDPPLDLWS